MYDELVKRLRERSVFLFPHHGESRSYDADLMHEAADAIEGLIGIIQNHDFLESLVKPEWIPVTETPKLKVGDEGYTGYLVYANGFYEIGDYTTDKFGNLEYFHVDGELETDVTHYMPLPGPPKEG